MIDTDQYEGHTPGPWEVNNPDDDKSLIFSVGALKFVSSANTRLIADAPLLLAEVQQLREVISRAINTLLSNPPEEMFESSSPTLTQDIGDLVGFYTQAMGHAIGILEGTE